MPSEQKHVWVVRRKPGAILLPISTEEAANVFRRAGWQVTELPISAFSEDEMRCLGVRRRHG